MRSTLEALERGYKGTAKTVAKMHKLVLAGKLDPTVQKIAYWIRLNIPEDIRGSGKATADAVFSWVKTHGVFTRDPFQIEKIEHPLEAMRPVIEARQAGKYSGPGLFTGDCDTYAVWIAALGGVLGFQYAFETSKSDADRPDEFSHIWGALLVGRVWYPLDASTPGVKQGWRPDVPADKFKRWPEEPVDEVSGMSGLHGNGNGSEYVDPQEFGYGIPKTIEPGRPFDVPVAGTDGGFEMFVPNEPSLSRGDMEIPEDSSMKKVRIPKPDDRVGDYAAIVAPRPNYVDPRPRISAQMPYPAGSYWNGPQKILIGEPSGKPYVNLERTQRIPVERTVRVVQQPPIVITKEQPPIQEGVEMGMGQGIVTSYDEDIATTAKDASGSIWDSITGAVSGLISKIPALATTAARAALTRVENKAKTALVDATNRVAGGAVVTPSNFTTTGTKATPWYLSPFVLIGGVILIGGIAYIATRPATRRNPRRRMSSVRRRVRRNPLTAEEAGAIERGSQRHVYSAASAAAQKPAYWLGRRDEAEALVSSYRMPLGR